MPVLDNLGIWLSVTLIIKSSKSEGAMLAYSTIFV